MSYKGLLDGLGTWPFVAYSLRRLTGSYWGAAIQVVRSSDGAAKDIPFTPGGDPDTASLLDFVGAGDGAVSIWYDQSGNGHHASAPAGARPYIVQGGVLVTVNAQPAVIANSDTDGQTLDSSFPAIDPAVSPFTINTVFNCAVPNPTGVVTEFLSATVVPPPTERDRYLIGMTADRDASKRNVYARSCEYSDDIGSDAPASSTDFNSVSAYNLRQQPKAIWLNGVQTTHTNSANPTDSIGGLSLGVPAIEPVPPFPTIMTSSLAEVILLPPGYEDALYQNQKTYWNTP
jgi:hypothetical protein